MAQSSKEHERDLAFRKVRLQVYVHPRIRWYLEELSKSGLFGFGSESEVADYLIRESLIRMQGDKSPLIQKTLQRIASLNGELTAQEKEAAKRPPRQKK